jgi:hypothetical protein
MISMKVGVVRESVEFPFLTGILPHYKSLNENLLKESEELQWLVEGEHRNSGGGSSNVKALRTPNNISSPHIKRVENLIEELVSLYLEGGFRGFKVSESWMNNYKKGDFACSHTHTGFGYSYVYFIKTPEGSSPLVFTSSGKKIKAEEGRIVIFPCDLYHDVPKNKCDGRITMAGNINHPMSPE